MPQDLILSFFTTTGKGDTSTDGACQQIQTVLHLVGRRLGNDF